MHTETTAYITIHGSTVVEIAKNLLRDTSAFLRAAGRTAAPDGVQLVVLVSTGLDALANAMFAVANSLEAQIEAEPKAEHKAEHKDEPKANGLTDKRYCTH